MIEYEVLRRFYYERGGQEVVSKRTAIRRLSREAYRAGKYAMKEKKFTEAREILRKSLAYKFSFKAYWLFMVSYFSKNHFAI
jgi:hypothetical protein